MNRPPSNREGRARRRDFFLAQDEYRNAAIDRYRPTTPYHASHWSPGRNRKRSRSPPRKRSRSLLRHDQYKRSRRRLRSASPDSRRHNARQSSSRRDKQSLFTLPDTQQGSFYDEQPPIVFDNFELEEALIGDDLGSPKPQHDSELNDDVQSKDPPKPELDSEWLLNDNVQSKDPPKPELDSKWLLDDDVQSKDSPEPESELDKDETATMPRTMTTA